MYNWSTDEKELKKDPKKYARWALEQSVNFGLNGKKIQKSALQKHWNDIQIDPARRHFLGKFLHGKTRAHR